MTILVDTREHALFEELKRKKLPIQIKKLEVGDYLFSDVAIERKTISDLYASLKNGRLWEELINIKNNFTRPVLLLEGIIPEPISYLDAKVNQEVYNALIANAMGQLKIPLIPSISHKVTATLLQMMYIKSDKSKTEYLRPVQRKSRSLADVKSDMICCVKNIGRKRAQRLVEKFDTIQKLCNASIADIASVKGISKKKAAELKQALTE